MQRIFLVLFLLLPVFATGAALPLLHCDACSEKAVLHQALQGRSTPGDIIVVDRLQQRAYKYQLYHPGTSNHALQARSIPLSRQEQLDIEAGYTVCRALARVGSLPYQALQLPANLADLGDSLLHLVGQPAAIKTVANAINAHMNSLVHAVIADALPRLAIEVIDGFPAAVEVRFDDGSRIDYDFARFRPGVRQVFYRADLSSARFADGTAIPMRAEDARWLTVLPGTPSLHAYPMALQRLGFSLHNGGKETATCNKQGIECDDRRCAFVPACI